jgi:UDP-N-acetylmuramyl pentapeptide phosphotransferase/UDP-N-acetylglucosamine-1-phosphate transferase
MQAEFPMITRFDVQVLLPFLLTVLGSVILVLRRRRILTSDIHIKEKHWIHSGYSYRWGGIIGLLATTVTGLISTDETFNVIFLVLVGSMPMIFAGFLEDIGKKIRPFWRILIAVAVSFLLLILFDVPINTLDVIWLDPLFTYAGFSLVFSIMLSSAIIHSFNLIDGLNGLSSGVVIIALTFVAAVTQDLSFEAHLVPILIVASTFFGFWIVNMLSGRLFLGDTGAYFGGICVVIFSLRALNELPDISIWAFAAMCAVPISDICLTTFRRIGNGDSFAKPDTRHLHHLVFFEIKYRFGLGEIKSNSVASSIVLLCSAATASLAYSLRHNILACFIIFSVFLTMYVAAWIFLARRLSLRAELRKTNYSA